MKSKLRWKMLKDCILKGEKDSNFQKNSSIRRISSFQLLNSEDMKFENCYIYKKIENCVLRYVF